jgi:hypothetical protein
LARLGVALVATASLVAVTPQPAQAMPACETDGVHVVFIRGTTAGLNSLDAQSFWTHIGGALAGYGIPAHKQGWYELGNIDRDGNIEYHEYPASADYNASVTTGTRELIDHLNGRYNGGGCPTETVILGGYSQGADVLGWTLEWQGYGGLSAEARRHIGFAALYGDPKRDATCPGGWWLRGNAGCGSSGVLQARSPYARDEYRGRFGSWCDAGDGFCIGSVTLGNHVDAYRATWHADSRFEVAYGAVRQLGILSPQQGSGVGSAVYKGTDTLNASQALHKNEYMMTPDGNFVLLHQTDGNVVLYGPRFQPIWSTGTSGNSNSSHLVMQPDGHLVLYNTSGQPMWYNNMSGSGGNRLSLQADGNLVEYNTSGQAVWHVNTGRAMPTFSPIGQDHIGIGTSWSLWPGQYIRSTNGTRFVVLQNDGNLVLYGPGHHILWHSATGGMGVNQLLLQPDGNLVLYKSNGQAAWHTHGSGNSASHFTVQNDGNLVQYNGAGAPVWWSGTTGQI